MAAGNEHWGYRRIAGELAGLGIAVAPSTVWEILKRHGIDPAPRRSGPGWAQFLRSQAEAILALDLFTVDLLDGTKACVLAAIEHATRRILAAFERHQPGSPGALLHRGPLRTGHARSRAPRPRQAARAVQVACCITVFPACRGGCLLRWQVACTRCVLWLRAALGVSWWTR